MFGFKKELYTPEYQLAGDECAVIETSKGTIKVKFDGEGAPIHVANFCELSTMGFYDGLKFHRYVPGFVIQGGDPNTRDMSGADVAAICQANGLTDPHQIDNVIAATEKSDFDLRCVKGAIHREKRIASARGKRCSNAD